jgi:MFS family permease
MMGYGMFFWLPSFFVRSFNLSLLDASLFFGAILLIGGLAGIWAGGWLGDRYGHTDRAQFARIPALAFIATIPFFVLAMLSSSLVLTFFLLLVPTALGLMWLGPTVATIQHLVQPGIRATASAIFLFINNLMGIGLGTWAIGALSDGLTHQFGADSLRYSILAGTGFYILAAVCFFLAARRLNQDWEE